ncbi:MAG: hypothetical protein OXG72_15910 [Acidobacteria bacterium]|nr:hypothetical protein [Acidobacteriota bacterium]
MGTMDEVMERLDATERQAGEVVRQLEEAESLHKSLIETRKGLEAVARDVNRLVTATLQGVDALREAVTAFKTATETFQRSDPGVVTATLKNMEARIEAIASEVSAISAINTEVNGLKATVVQTASVNEERTRAMIDNAVEEVSGQSLIHRLLGRRRSVKAKQNTEPATGP